MGLAETPLFAPQPQHTTCAGLLNKLPPPIHPRATPKEVHNHRTRASRAKQGALESEPGRPAASPDGLYLVSEWFLPWTDVSGVGALAQVSKPWLNETEVQALWRDFVVDRWRVVPKHAPRVYGAPSWQLVSA